MGPGKHEDLQLGRSVLAKIVTIDWVTEHRKRILTTVSTVLVLLLCVIPFTKRMKGSNRSDYLAAEAAFSAWTAQTKHDLNLFKQMRAPLVRHPN